MMLICTLGLIAGIPARAGVVVDCSPAYQELIREQLKTDFDGGFMLSRSMLRDCPQVRPEDLGLTRAKIEDQQRKIADAERAADSAKLNQAKMACRPTDLSHDPRLPPRKTQGEHTWCLSYAMATSTSFALKIPVSAVGFVMAPAWQNGIHEGDTIPETPKETEMKRIFDTAQRWGFCRESSLPSDTKTPGQLKSRYDLISFGPQAPTCSLHGTPMKQLGAIRESFRLNEAQTLKSLYRVDHPDTRLMQMAADSCENLKLVATTKLQFKYFGSRPKAYDKMDAALNAGNIVGVGYDSQPVLRTTNNFGHESNIIGRRWTGTACEYLVRDPYGANTPSRRPNDQGDVWVPRADLEAGAATIWSVEPI